MAQAFEGKDSMAVASGSGRVATARFLYRWRGHLTAILTLGVVTLAVLGGTRLYRLQQAVAALGPAADVSEPKLVDSRFEVWFAEGDPLLESLERYQVDFGAEEALVIASQDPDEDLAPLIAALRSLEGVTDVAPINTGNALLVQLSQDLGTAHVAERLLPDDPSGQHLAIRLYTVEAQRRTLAEVERLLDEASASGVGPYRLAGFPINERALEAMAMRDLLLQGAVVALFAAVLFGLFRRVSIVAIVLCTVGGSVAGMLGLAFARLALFNNLTSIAPMIVTVIGIADSVHLIASYEKLQRRGLRGPDLIRNVLQDNIVPVVLTSVTTAIGFFSLATSTLAPVRTLGWMAGTGALLACALSLSFVPWCLSLLPSRSPSATEGALSPSAFARLGERVLACRPAVLGLTLGIVALSAWGASRVVVDTDSAAFFPPGHPVIEDIRWLERNVGGFGTIDLLVPLADADPGEVVAELEAVGEKLTAATDSPEAPLSLVTGLWGPTLGSEHARLIVRVELASSARHLAVGERIEAIARAHPLLAQATSTGKFLIYARLFTNLEHDYIRSMLLALGLITLVIALYFRSLAMAVVSIVPNMLPVIAPLAIPALWGAALDGPAIFVSSIALGICVDDTIHLLTRFRAFVAAGSTPAVAVCQALQEVGKALTVTTLTLMLGFSVLVFAQFWPNVVIGQLAVLMIGLALVFDLVVLPALLSLGGETHAASSPGDPGK